MVSKQHKQQVDADFEDQYSMPVCKSDTTPPGTDGLGPNTTQLLGLLQAFEGKKD